MNNPDLRRVIFSYFRNKHYKICHKCKNPCQLNKNKKLKDFVEWTGFVNCHSCFRKGYIGNRIIFNNNILL